MMPAPTACATASDSFFLCILFIMNPHGVEEYYKLRLTNAQVLDLSPASGHWTAQGSTAGDMRWTSGELMENWGFFPGPDTVATVQQREFRPQQNARVGYNRLRVVLQICQRAMRR